MASCIFTPEVVASVQRYLRQEYDASSSHNFDHVRRVLSVATKLAGNYPGADLEIIAAAALFHDVGRKEEEADSTGLIDHAALGARKATEFLGQLQLPAEFVGKVGACIASHRFRSGNRPKLLEAQLLFDADKIDILGATGIARCYMVTGQFNQKIYSDAKDCDLNQLRMKHRSNYAPNIEYDVKLKHLPSLLYTDAGRELARARLDYMDGFFGELRRELDVSNSAISSDYQWVGEVSREGGVAGYAKLRNELDLAARKAREADNYLDKTRAAVDQMERDWDFRNCCGGDRLCAHFGNGAKCSAPGKHHPLRRHVWIDYLNRGILDCPLRKEDE